MLSNGSRLSEKSKPRASRSNPHPTKESKTMASDYEEFDIDYERDEEFDEEERI